MAAEQRQKREALKVEFKAAETEAEWAKAAEAKAAAAAAEEAAAAAAKEAACRALEDRGLDQVEALALLKCLVHVEFEKGKVLLHHNRSLGFIGLVLAGSVVDGKRERGIGELVGESARGGHVPSENAGSLPSRETVVASSRWRKALPSLE